MLGCAHTGRLQPSHLCQQHITECRSVRLLLTVPVKLLLLLLLLRGLCGTCLLELLVRGTSRCVCQPQLLLAELICCCRMLQQQLGEVNTHCYLLQQLPAHRSNSCWLTRPLRPPPRPWSGSCLGVHARQWVHRSCCWECC